MPQATGLAPSTAQNHHFSLELIAREPCRAMVAVKGGVLRWLRGADAAHATRAACSSGGGPGGVLRQVTLPPLPGSTGA
jgi:hypothetical protein